jgi:hypothetical protein
MHTKPGIKRFTAFAAKVKPLEPTGTCFMAKGPPQCCFTNAQATKEMSPAEMTDDESMSSAEDNDGTNLEGSTTTAEDAEAQPTEPMDFEAHADAEGVSMENEVPMTKDIDELYRLHVQCGHLSFDKL